MTAGRFTLNGSVYAAKKLTRATVSAVALPVDLAVDAVTLGGASTQDGHSAVVKRGKKIWRDLEDAVEEIGE